MNFFAQQERARTNTKRMFVLFVLAVICIVLAVDFVLLMAFGVVGNNRHHTAPLGNALPTALFWTSALVLAVIGFSSMFRVSQLRGGGSVVAEQMGGTLVPPDTTDFARKRLRNVIEEIAIASGVPMPDVYVLEGEPAINAFAAGYTPADAAVTVTEGCLQKLNREELQGVIAHEFSHVLNGDMRLNIRLMGVLFGILVIGIIGRRMLFSGGRSRNSGNTVWLGVAILAIGYVGVFFGRLIKAGISRQREYLADASAVQFTRQTRGIGGALKKIGGLSEGSKLATIETEEVAHMLFGDGVGYSAMFATHPPLVKRIKAIDPTFNESEFAAIYAAWENPVPVGNSERADVSLAGFAPAGIAAGGPTAAAGAAKQVALPETNAPVRVDVNKVSQHAGVPSENDIDNAGAINRTIPERLRTAAYMTAGSVQVIFALTLNQDEQVRSKQLDIIEKYFDADTRAGVEMLAGDLPSLHPLQRLPLAQLAFPVLRRRPRPELQTFLVALNELVQADGTVSIEEYCLAKLVNVQVIDALDPSRAKPTGAARLPDCSPELADVFALVARYGSDDEADAERAYLLGMNEVDTNSIPAYAPPQDWSLALDRALPKLNTLMPAGKELLVRGLTRAIDADGVVSVTEAELLRTICAGLHCPLPPMVDQEN